MQRDIALLSRNLGRSPRACARCRATKVKCKNSGHVPCQGCAQASVECIFLPTRKERALARQQKRSGEQQQAASMARETSFPVDSSQVSPIQLSTLTEEPHHRPESSLHGPVASPQSDDSSASHLETLYSLELVVEAVEVFFRHFSQDIFFSLHEPSVRLAAKVGTIKPVLAVAILALTARFIPRLVNKYGSPLAAGDHFADAIRSELLLQADKPSLERIHALLFLSMHEWGSGRGARAWIYIGLAMRTALLLRTFRKETPLAPPFNKPVETSQEFIIEESRVRVFWSMLLMEYFVTSGKGRISATYDERKLIERPCDEDDFLWGTLRNNLSSFPSTSEKSCLIAAVENWNIVNRWVSSGGAKEEQEAPWIASSRFNQLCVQLHAWEEHLPSRLQYSQSAFLVHAVNNRAGTYGFLHLVNLTSVIFLHREYLQFFPDPRKCYDGRLPAHLDPGRSPHPFGSPEAIHKSFSSKDTFWKTSLNDLFTAARQITEILTELEGAGALMNTPFVGFAAFTAASMNMYLAIFPWVYPELSTNALERAETDVRHLKFVLSYWPLAQQWYNTVLRLYESYKLFHMSGRTPQTPSGDVIEAFHSFDRSLMDYGEIKPGPEDMAAIISAKDNDGYRHGFVVRSTELGPSISLQSAATATTTTTASNQVIFENDEVSQPCTPGTDDGREQLTPNIELDGYWNAATEGFLTSMLDTG